MSDLVGILEDRFYHDTAQTSVSSNARGTTSDVLVVNFFEILKLLFFTLLLL